jgi:hypothetical protein
MCEYIDNRLLFRSCQVMLSVRLFLLNNIVLIFCDAFLPGLIHVRSLKMGT